MTSIPEALLWCLSAGTAAAVVLTAAVARARTHSADLRQRLATSEAQHLASQQSNSELTARLRAVEAEIQHLAGARLPDLSQALAHPHVPVRGLLDNRFAGTGTDLALSAVLEQTATAVTKERERVDAAAQSTLRGATTTIQALLYRLQTSLQDMQHRYDDPGVAQDLLAADFLNEQALRRIQATGVVCGAWPGLTREDSYLAELVVGASSRLRGYERVQISNQLRDPVAVVARAVEPIAITVTELLANALHHSHHGLPVAVTLQQGNRGASVIIDDYGVGMHPDELRRAEELLSGDDELLFTQLGDPPRSGFAAAGRLVRQYGFGVHVEPSPYGGVRAVVYVPGDPLLTVLDENVQPMSVMAPLPHHSGAPDRPHTPLPSRAAQAAPSASSAAQAPAARREAGADTPVRSRTRATQATDATAGGSPGAPADAAAEGGLPRRQRRRPAAEAEQSLPRAEPAPARTPEDNASRWAALQQGTESGRAAGRAGTESGEQPPGDPRPPRHPEGNALS
ncbi:sensor histidine kinase [Streptomyces sp. NBC_00237]|uniref:ATP-binding protein n=1 Tax=Streptomyces sp. NBC_00237 TaxID=2975687 RepID=UPI00224D8653|nr:ATP-binding protein [Streptomyces sp. NBC_00237]MCX5205496.1 sensor histidine kinase [Streptomyces sp. NBC_00237]